MWTLNVEQGLKPEQLCCMCTTKQVLDALLDASVTGYKGKERMQAEDGAERVSAKGTQATILHGENAVATAKAPENALSTLALRGVQDLQALLQTFFESREARITVHLEDACEVIACWQDRQALCTKLHTLQQSGLAYADSGWHASMRFVYKIAYVATERSGVC